MKIYVFVKTPVDKDSYNEYLQKYLDICDELKHSLMMPKTRRELKTAKEAMSVILDMYEFDYR